MKKVIPIENPYLAPLYFEDRNTKQATFFINKAYLIVEGGFAYEPLETCPDSFYEDESILKRNSTDRSYSYEFYVLSIGWDGNKPVSSIYKKTMWEVPLKDCRNDLWCKFILTCMSSISTFLSLGYLVEGIKKIDIHRGRFSIFSRCGGGLGLGLGFSKKF